MNLKSYSIFFKLLRAGLWENDVRFSLIGEIDYDEILRIAEEQSVIGLIASGFDKAKDVKLPQSIAHRVIGNTLQLEQRNLSMNHYIAGLVEKLSNAGICTILVKGQGVAQCYERPLWRVCGDIDLLLSKEDYKKAKVLLLPLGEITEPEELDKRHLAMCIDGWIVELHGTLHNGLSARVDGVLNEVQKDTFINGSKRTWNNEGVQVFLLKAEDDVFYVFTHILQHFYKGGVGLRQICDWSRLLWTYRDKLDLSLLESQIRKAGLMKVWRAFGAYAVDYLGMPDEAMPFYSPSSCWKRKAKRINKFILSVGNMGHNRDTRYMNYPYLIQKGFSATRRIGDLFNHTMIFPLESLKFLPHILYNGVKSATRGE